MSSELFIFGKEEIFPPFGLSPSVFCSMYDIYCMLSVLGYCLSYFVSSISTGAM